MSNIVISKSEKLASTLGVSGDGVELMQALKATAFKGQVNDSQMAALLIVADQYNLNPWTKEIYAFPDKNNGIVPVVGVDGWARIINSHPQFDGMEFEQDSDSCTCIMYRKDRSRPVKITEYMSECKRANTGPWQSHPKRMLRHKAMIQCARMAFGFGGIYDQDEAERIIDMGDAIEVPAPSKPTATTAQQPSPELIAQAEQAASTGMAGYSAFWKQASADDRKAITASGHHAACKATAEQVDAQRTVEAPTQASKSFEEVLAMICKAETDDALYVAGDWINSITDAEQSGLLNDKFDERLAQLRGTE